MSETLKTDGKTDAPGSAPHPQAAERRRSAALWLGGGEKTMEMGFGRGPRSLKGYELVSWFFSRDGI